MYAMINIEIIIDTLIVVIFDEELGITPKDDSQTQLITEENKNLLYNGISKILTFYSGESKRFQFNFVMF